MPQAVPEGRSRSPPLTPPAREGLSAGAAVGAASVAIQSGSKPGARSGRRFAQAVSLKAPAESQDRSVPAKRRRRFDERIGKARMDKIPPAIQRPAPRGFVTATIRRCAARVMAT